MVLLRPANDNRPQWRETRTSRLLGRGLIVAAAAGIVVALLFWLGWSSRLLWSGPSSLGG